jgi:hypothetical protein
MHIRPIADYIINRKYSGPKDAPVADQLRRVYELFYREPLVRSREHMIVDIDSLFDLVPISIKKTKSPFNLYPWLVG